MAIPSYDWIAYHASRRPRQPATIDLATGRHLTYQDFDDRIARLASHLRSELNVSVGDRVAVLAQNTTDTLEVEFACGRLGAIFVPLNWRLSEVELQTIVLDCAPAALFHDIEFAQRSISPAATCSIAHTCMLGGVDTPYELAIQRAARLGDPAVMTHDDPWSILRAPRACPRERSSPTVQRYGIQSTQPASRLYRTKASTSASFRCSMPGECIS
jgi:fatty-acyl-CoA synthase